MLIEYAESELTKAERIVLSNASWLVLVPFWATWPFETILLPRPHLHLLRLDELGKPELLPVKRGFILSDFLLSFILQIFTFPISSLVQN